MAAPQNLVQGDSWVLDCQWLNPMPGRAGTNPADPVDITGFNARLQVRLSPEQPAVLTLTSDPGGGLTVDGPNGQISIHATPTQTATIGPGDYIWELEIENGVDRYTLVTAPLKVKAQYSV